MGAGPVVGPRRGVQAVADRDAHQLVVGGVVLDLVDAMAVAVVGVQDRPVAVGQLAPALRLRRAGQRAEFGDLVEAPLAALADQRLDEHRRGGRVVVLQRRDLVGDDVRIGHAADITLSRQPHKMRNGRVDSGHRRQLLLAQFGDLVPAVLAGGQPGGLLRVVVGRAGERVDPDVFEVVREQPDGLGEVRRVWSSIRLSRYSPPPISDNRACPPPRSARSGRVRDRRASVAEPPCSPCRRPHTPSASTPLSVLDLRPPFCGHAITMAHAATPIAANAMNGDNTRHPAGPSPRPGRRGLRMRIEVAALVRCRPCGNRSGRCRHHRGACSMSTRRRRSPPHSTGSADAKNDPMWSCPSMMSTVAPSASTSARTCGTIQSLEPT